MFTYGVGRVVGVVGTDGKSVVFLVLASLWRLWCLHAHPVGRVGYVGSLLFRSHTESAPPLLLPFAGVGLFKGPRDSRVNCLHLAVITNRQLGVLGTLSPAIPAGLCSLCASVHWRGDASASYRNLSRHKTSLVLSPGRSL